MKRLLQITILCMISIQSFGQMIMSAEGINPDNVCKPGSVYFLMQRRAKPVEPIDSIEVRLNKIVSFARENPSFAAEPSLQFAVSCHGEVGGGFHIVTESGNEELDDELISFFKTIEEWKPGKKNKRKAVDSWYMWRLEIKDGFIDILNK